MHLVSRPLVSPNPALTPMALRVERQTLAKRLWRGTAADGTDFGFELDAPLKPGDVFFESASARYLIEQIPEPVVEIALEMNPPPPPASAGRSAICTSNWPPSRRACLRPMNRPCVSCWNA
jgi:hypothetical protein